MTHDYQFDEPLQLVIELSREFVASRLGQLPGGASSTATDAVRRRILSCVEGVWDVLLASSTEQIVVHAPQCARLSMQEQALLLGIRSLQENRVARFELFMGAVLPRASIRAIRPHMEDLAITVSWLQHAGVPNAQLQTSAALH